MTAQPRAKPELKSPKRSSSPPRRDDDLSLSFALDMPTHRKDYEDDVVKYKGKRRPTFFSFFSSDELSGGGWSNGSTRRRVSHSTRIKAREFRLQFNQFKSFFKFLGVDARKRLVRPKLSLPFQLLKDREEKIFREQTGEDRRKRKKT